MSSVDRDLERLRRYHRKNGWSVGGYGETGEGQPCLENSLNRIKASGKTWKVVKQRTGSIRVARWNDKQRSAKPIMHVLRPRQEVMPQPVAKPVKEKKPTKVRQQPSAATSGVIAVVALVGLALMIRLLQIVASFLVMVGHAVIDAVNVINVVVGAAAPWVIGAEVVTLTMVSIDWAHVRAWYRRRQEVRSAVETQRAEWLALVEADAAPIPMGPAQSDPMIDKVSAEEHDRIAKAWMPGTYVPDLAPEWRRPPGV